MVMCASGNLAELSAPQGGCSSISLAACGTIAGPKCMTALATAAGKSLPINMTTCWYGYNDSLVVTPTSIINIPAAGAVCNVLACAPAFNTFTNSCGGCTWFHPTSPTPPSPAGTSQGITIDANATNICRCGCACYTPICGTIQCVCLYQLGTPDLITFNLITSNCGAGVTADGCLSVISTPAMTVGQCYCLCLCGCLHSGGGASSSACWVVYNGGSNVYCCTIGTSTTATPSYSLKVGSGTVICLCLHAVVTAGFTHSCSCGSIGCVTSITDMFAIGTCSSYNLWTC